jgi:glycosyltransferase involved in cell wall biosynthesis
VVPGGVDAEVFRPLDRAAERDRPFRFLCVGKWENRKNIGQLVEAFGREFRAEEPVELVLHCFNPYLPHLDVESEVRRLAPQSHAPIRISHPVAGESMVELYNSSDVFALPARAEGWGLPIVEAMACGLPAIVTNYSALTDYLNESNGYPLRVAKMVDVYDPFFYPAGWDLGQWAEPDFDDLRRLMRHVFEHPEEARAKGRQARADVCNRWTWDHAAATAYRRLRPERFAAHAGAE